MTTEGKREGEERRPRKHNQEKRKEKKKKKRKKKRERERERETQESDEYDESSPYSLKNSVRISLVRAARAPLLCGSEPPPPLRPLPDERELLLLLVPLRL